MACQDNKGNRVQLDLLGTQAQMVLMELMAKLETLEEMELQDNLVRQDNGVFLDQVDLLDH